MYFEHVIKPSRLETEACAIELFKKKLPGATIERYGRFTVFVASVAVLSTILQIFQAR